MCENHDYCYEEMSKGDNKISKYSHGEKSLKVPFITYADLQSLLSTCRNNSEKPSTTKINKHKGSGFSLFTHCSFDTIKNPSIIIALKTVWRNFVGN